MCVPKGGRSWVPLEKVFGDLVDLCWPFHCGSDKRQRRYACQLYVTINDKRNKNPTVGLLFVFRSRRVFCVLQPPAPVVHREQHHQRREDQLQRGRLGKLRRPWRDNSFKNVNLLFISKLFPLYSASPPSFVQQGQRICTYFIRMWCWRFIYFISRST